MGALRVTPITVWVSDIRTWFLGLDPGPAALSAVGAGLLVLLLLGLVLLFGGRARRRREGARAAVRAQDRGRAQPRPSSPATTRREPTVRRSTPPPLFASRDTEPDPLTVGLNGAKDALGVIEALKAADHAELDQGEVHAEVPLAATEPIPVLSRPAVEPSVRPAVTPAAEARRPARGGSGSTAPWMVIAGAAALLLLRRRHRSGRQG
jgi:hypothetical protein